jgi:hypothetical protein
VFGRPHTWSTWYHNGQLQRTADTCHCYQCGGVCVADEAANAHVLAAQLGALHGAARYRPYGDLDDGGGALLLTALGETDPADAENRPRRRVLLETYREAYRNPYPATWPYGIMHGGAVVARFPIQLAALDALGSYDAGSTAVLASAEARPALAGRGRGPAGDGLLGALAGYVDEWRRPAPPPQVWVLEHIHRHGGTIGAHAAEAGAIAAAAAIARDGWANITGRPGVPDSPDGLDDEQAMRMYFAERGGADEQLRIHALDVEAAPAATDL